MTDIEATTDVDGQDGSVRSRRQLLTLAGAAAVGGTAMVVAGATPAGAADGDALLIGESNNGSSGTSLSTTGGNGLTVSTGDASASASSIEGGLLGNSSVDIKAGGSGRLAQASSPSGDVEPDFSIPSRANGFGGFFVSHEIVRSTTGVLWASRGTHAAGTSWKRMNTPRFDNPDGSGDVFAPFRLLDTRAGQASAISRSTPLPTNTNTNIDVDNLANIPTGTVGVFGNITVLNSNYTGFVTLFPTGAATPTVANINFGTGELVGNFFQVGLNSSGSLTIRPGDAAGRTVDVIIDIFGYVQ